jgi:hypothetical protein
MSEIPTELTEHQFEQYVADHLSRGKRGPLGQLSHYQVFNHILYWLHTGCQWDELPIVSSDGEKKKKHGNQFIINLSVGVRMVAFSGYGSIVSW